MKNIAIDKMEELSSMIHNRILFDNAWSIKNKLIRYLAIGEIDDCFWDTHDEQYDYKIKLDNQDIRLFLLHLIELMEGLDNSAFQLKREIKATIKELEKQGEK